MHKLTRRILWEVVILAILAVVIFTLVGAVALAADGTAAPPGMDYGTAWTIITGLVATFVIGFLTRQKWPDWAKVLAAGVVSVALAFAQLALFGDPVWSWANWWPIAAGVFVFAKLWFTAIAWKIPKLKAWWDRYWLIFKDPNPLK